jgi:3',5'-cyclic AMP phosphodiesterase CpdA
MTRRGFLRAGLAAGGAFVLGPRRLIAQEGREEVRWAFLSDTHIAADPENNYRGFYPYRNLQKVLEWIRSDLPEGLVITGDLARLTGQAGDYESFKKLMMPVIEERPVCLALGNHDDRENFARAFEKSAGAKQPVKGKHVVVVNAGPVRFVLLDSLLYVEKTPGLLGKAQRTWLEEYLRTCDDRPTLLFFHHTLGDADGDLLDILRLFELVRPIRKVKAIVYGHSHEYAYGERDGIHLINLPATAYTFGSIEPIGWVEAKLTGAGGRFTLHAIGGNDVFDGFTKGLAWRS